MFGYVKIFKPELKIKDYEAYKGIYCTLCKTLGKKYGLWSRFTLSYDFTFFTAIRMLAAEKCPAFSKSHCTFNPLKKCLKCNSCDDEFDYAAALAMIMLFYKLQDDICDLPFFKKLPAYLLYPLARRAKRKAASLFPHADKIVLDMMKNQCETEKLKDCSIDRAAHASSFAMSKLMSYGFEGDSAVILDRIGYCIGRWVYIADAFDDFESDYKTGSFNPFIIKYGAPSDEAALQVKEKASTLLTQTADEAYEAFALMDKGCFSDLIDNVLDCGLYNCKNEILKRKDVKK